METTSAPTETTTEVTLEEPVGYGHQCPYCNHWFHSTAFRTHLDDEFDMMALLGQSPYAN